MTEKPICPTCPGSHVVNASRGVERVWVCIVCGANLGKAPPYEPEWEQMKIGPEKSERIP